MKVEKLCLCSLRTTHGGDLILKLARKHADRGNKEDVAAKCMQTLEAQRDMELNCHCHSLEEMISGSLGVVGTKNNNVIAKLNSESEAEKKILSPEMKSVCCCRRYRRWGQSGDFFCKIL